MCPNLLGITIHNESLVYVSSKFTGIRIKTTALNANAKDDMM